MTQVSNMHIHGECFIYKNIQIYNRLRKWYVVTSKVGGDLT